MGQAKPVYRPPTISKKQGFKDVTVFEGLSHVGGMCHSVTEHQHSVALGASFVSPTFRHVISAAKEHGVKLTRFSGVIGFTFCEAKRTAEYKSLPTEVKYTSHRSKRKP